MKILKYIFLLLILSAIAVTVFIATQNGKYTITQQKVILAPKETLFGYINDYKNWQNLSLLTGADSTAVYNYSENTTGAGAFMAWQKGDTDGTIKTAKATTDSIVQDAAINGLKSSLKWMFKDTLGGTKVSVTIQGELTFAEKARALLNSADIDKAYSKSAAKGLENLDTYLVSDLKKYDVQIARGLVKKLSTFYLAHTATTTKDKINQTVSEYSKKLLGFTGKNRITVTGEPFIIYKNFSYNRDTLTYSVCVPIKDEIFTTSGSEFEGGKLQAFNALKTTLTGDYTHLPKAWAASKKYITENALPENTALPYVVNYTKNTKQSRRPSSWVTDLYTPIGPALVTPTPADSLKAANVQPVVMPPAGTTQKPQAVKPKTTQPQGSAPATTTPSKPKAVTPAKPRPKATDSIK